MGEKRLYYVWENCPKKDGAFMRVAVCDDTKAFADALCQALYKTAVYGKAPFLIDPYYNGEALLAAHEKKRYDLIFLDIELPGKNGVEIGRYLRENLSDSTVEIVYVSGKTEYSMQLFAVQPLDFLVKPIELQRINALMELFMRRQLPHGQRFGYCVGREQKFIPIPDIYYLRSNVKQMEIHLKDQTISYPKNRKISEMAGELLPLGFIQTGHSYLVNKEKIESITASDVVLLNGEILPISRGYHALVMQSIFPMEETPL